MTFPILIIEDSDDFFFLIKMAFRESGFDNPIYHCESGDEGLDYLLRNGTYSDPRTSPRPGIVLLDLRLPGTDGSEVLQIIKKNERLKTIPVIVLTSSTNEDDFDRCYRNGANSCITKPFDIGSLNNKIRLLGMYWFKTVFLPEGASL